MAERIVDGSGAGQHATIGEAIDAAGAGDRIVVRPGLYREGLLIDKPGLEIVGEGGEVVVEAGGQNAVLFRTATGRVANLTLRQTEEATTGFTTVDQGTAMVGDETRTVDIYGWYCVDIPEGELHLEGCDISARGKGSIAIWGTADPILRGNRIHDGRGPGVCVFEGGRGTLEDNDIFDNGPGGEVAVFDGGHPTLRDNRIHGGAEGGVLVFRGGRANLEGNDIFANTFAGVEVTGGAQATLQGNQIHDGREMGVKVWNEGHAILEDNTVSANGLSGVAVMGGSDANLSGNRIMDNRQAGVYIHDSRVTLVDNDISANDLVGVLIANGAEAVIQGNRINRNGEHGIAVQEPGSSVVEDNDLGGNAKGAWDLPWKSRLKLKRHRNQD